MGANQWRFNEAISNVGNFWASQILAQKERDRIEAERQKQLDTKNQANVFARQLAQGGSFENRPTPINVPNRLSQVNTSDLPKDLDPNSLLPINTSRKSAPPKSMKINDGNALDVNNIPFRQPQTYAEQFVPYNQQQKNSIAMQLASNPYGADTYSGYTKILQDMNPQKKQKEFNGSLYEVNPDGSIGKMIIQKQPEKLYDKESEYVLEVDPNTKARKVALDDKGQPVVNDFYNPTPKYLRTEYDAKTRKYVDLEGYMKGGKEVVANRKYIAPTKNVNGQPHISKESNALLNDYYKQQQKYLADYTSAKSGGGLYDNSGQIRTVPEMAEVTETQPDGSKLIYNKKKGERAMTATDVAAAMASHNKKYINLVKSGMPEGLKSWYGDYFNRKGKTKPENNNGNQETFWTSLLGNWKKGNLTPAEFQYGMHLYRATYAEDPTQRFGTTMPQFDSADEEE
jgi:hypothetical protein